MTDRLGGSTVWETTGAASAREQQKLWMADARRQREREAAECEVSQHLQEHSAQALEHELGEMRRRFASLDHEPAAAVAAPPPRRRRKKVVKKHSLPRLDEHLLPSPASAPTGLSGPLDAAALLLHCLQHPEEDAEEDAARRRRARAKVRRRLEDDRLSETSQSARASLPRIASQTDARLAALPDESSRTSSQPRARTPRELRRAKRLVTGSHTGLFSRADLQLISTLLPAKAEDEEEEEQTAARAPRRKRRSRQTQSQSQGGRREQRSAARDAPLPKTSGGSPLGESGSLNGANALLISRGTDAVRGSSLEDRRSSIREELGCERNARQRKTMEALQSKGHMVREEVEEWQSLLRMDPLEKDEVVEEEPDPKHDTRCAVHLNVPGLLASVYLGDFCKLELGECVRLVSGQRDTLERVLKESK